MHLKNRKLATAASTTLRVPCHSKLLIHAGTDHVLAMLYKQGNQGGHEGQLN